MNHESDLDRNELHELFSQKLNDTISPENHDRLVLLLRENESARQLWLLYCDNEIGLSELSSTAMAGERVVARQASSRGAVWLAPAIGLFVGVLIGLAAGVWLVDWTDNALTADSPQEERGESQPAVALAPPQKPMQPIEESRVPGAAMSEAKISQVELPQAVSLSKVSAIPPSWTAITASASDAENLYLVNDERLYRISTDGDRWRAVGGDRWRDVAAIGVAEGGIYVVSEDKLFRVDSKTGARRPLGKKTWTNVRSIENQSGQLLIVCQRAVYRVELEIAPMP